MSETVERPIISKALRLTEAQVQTLQPYFERRAGSFFLVGSIYADGAGWSMQISALPEERRLAVRAACRGELTLPAKRKSKTVPFPSTPPAA